MAIEKRYGGSSNVRAGEVRLCSDASVGVDSLRSQHFVMSINRFHRIRHCAELAWVVTASAAAAAVAHNDDDNDDVLGLRQ